MGKTDALDGIKYISLETYKKDNSVIHTPVWFIIKDDKVYVITREFTGKVKRLANNPKLRLAPCTFKGGIEGKWIDGIAKMIPESDIQEIVKLRKKKYGFKALLAGFMTKSKGKMVAYEITLL